MCLCVYIDETMRGHHRRNTGCVHNLEGQVVWSRKLLETQMAQNEVLFEEQHQQAAEQVDTPATYFGYSYLAGENGVVLKLKDGGLKHFSSEAEAVAYVDSVASGER
jgi:hypothetical protein